MKNIILIGPQGSGKGTQAAMIKHEFSIPHISTGDMLRENISKGTKLGKKVKALLDKGIFVSDKITNAIVKERLKRNDCKTGFILDGYPRNLAQAKALGKFAKINMVFEIHINDKLAIKRLSSRRQCKNCGAIFGIGVPPKVAGKCDKCGGQLYQRDDEKPRVIKKRLSTYKKKTKPILDFYREKGVLIKLDGSQDRHRLFEEIKEKVIELEKPKLKSKAHEQSSGVPKHSFVTKKNGQKKKK